MSLASSKKQRGALRAQFTKVVNSLEAEVAKNSDISVVQGVLRQLEDRAVLLFKVDDEIASLMAGDATITGDEYNAEIDGQMKYRDTLITKQTQVEALLSVVTSTRPQGDTNRKFKLPQLEIKKFDGDVKCWLGFWGQFSKIHEDRQIPAVDKFQYLLQSTEPGSKAREICESFPASGDSYVPLVEQLKDRFGRHDVLVEVYVRELLRMVANAIHPKEKMSLSNLYDKLESQLRCLKSLGITADKYSILLNPLVESCLPEEILRAWERKRDNNKNITDRLKELMDFLREEVAGEERIQLARSGFGTESTGKARTKRLTTGNDISTAMDLLSVSEHQKNRISCIFCNKIHASQDCFKAANMTLEEKRKIVNDKGACFKCLRTGHFSKKCKSNVKCPLCSARHFIILCPDLNNRQTNKIDTSNKVLKSNSASMENSTNMMAAQSMKEHVLLQTLAVRVIGNGKEKIIRAVIDTGSQNTYVLSSTTKAIGITPVGQERLSHILFGGVTSDMNVHNKYILTVSPINGSNRIKMEALDQPVICGKISRLSSGPILNELRDQNIVLTDVGENCPEIELLIGSDVAGNLLTGKIVNLKSGPVAIETKLGWTLMGKVLDSHVNGVALAITSLFVQNASINALWDLETIGIRDPVERKSKDEIHEAVQDHFNKTVVVNPDGRYEVNLPWIEVHPDLPSNKNIAKRRLLTTTRKLQQSGLFQEYGGVFSEWLSESIIEVVPSDEPEMQSHFLPHRAVVKESSETTKIRPVFDASAREGHAPSLNDCLDSGPNLLELIPNLITQFRKNRYGVTADIKKAFLQIGIAKQDRNFLKFFWWQDQEMNDPIIFRHMRVVFGITCGPFLLGACIGHLLNTVADNFRQTADKLRSTFYVDNCLTSVSSVDELKKFVSESSDIMASAQFELRGWEHTRYPGDDRQGIVTNLLGIQWDTNEDSLSCNIPDVKESSGPITKRMMLSFSHKLFDPIGFTCPVLLLPKLLLKETWNLKTKWDEELPDSICERFLKWLDHLPILKAVKIPRWLAAGNGTEGTWSFHVFADASQNAYAACVYLRIENGNGVSVQLVQAKSRISPMKRASIPRLELIACCVATRLLENVKKGLNIENVRVEYWSDSMDALYWIKTDDRWGTFVWNRVKEIRSVSSPTQWHHVPGILNPADLPSRGCTPRQLIASRWWEGPQWLYLPESQWPATDIICNEETVSEERRKTVASMAVLDDREQFSELLCRRVSRYTCVVGIVARLYRLTGLTNALKDENYENCTLSVDELKHGEKKLLLLVQREAFGDENCDSLKQLNVFRDNDGLIRVKTKLLFREDVNNFKYPVVLPSHHPVVYRLILEKHRQLCHAGVNMLMSVLREEYWLLKSRKTIRRILNDCGKCKRFTSKPYYVGNTPLPPDRVNTAKVFEIVGVDLAGPLYLKGGKRCWIVIYTCAVYRAVHLELTTSMSTIAFMESFRRFISRRGRPAIVYSDNGRNFVGTSEALRQLDWSTITETCALKRIQWKFNPPYAAWWGGWWERLIRVVKDLLRRILGKSVLYYDELYTVLCDCESIINSRPLTYISEDGGDLLALTPSMFLNEISNYEVFDLDQVDAAHFNRRIRYIQNLRSALRHRFRNEYLGLLTMASDKRRDDVILPNSVVLIKNDKTKRINWPLARVLETFAGRDGKTRVARLRTKGGECVRAVQSLCPLEVPSDEMLPSPFSIAVNEDSVSADNLQGGSVDSDSKEPECIVTRSGRKVCVPKRLNLFAHL